MRLLLDTHIAIWVVTSDARLTAHALAIIDDGEAVLVSAVSIWEIAIKHALGRSGPSAMPFSGDEAISLFKASGFEFLPVTPEHAAAVERLPGAHGDPFDRLLAAQTLAEPLRLVTHDGQVARYGDRVILV